MTPCWKPSKDRNLTLLPPSRHPYLSPTPGMLIACTFLMGNREAGSWVWTWVMAMVMANCIRRSNAVNHYGPKYVRCIILSDCCRMIYKEYLVFASLSYAITYFIANVAFGLALLSPISTWALRKILPAPGSGPSEAQMNEGFLKVTTFGVGMLWAQASFKLSQEAKEPRWSPRSTSTATLDTKPLQGTVLFLLRN